jgi:hypothetical protein
MGEMKMKKNLYNFKSVIVFTTLVFFVVTLGFENAFAQDDPLRDDRPQVVTRVAKKKRTRTPRKKKYTPPKKLKVNEDYVPLLSLVAQLYKVDNFNTDIPINPFVQAQFGTRLRLALKPNQEGYLYIIHQRSEDQDGTVIFPSPTINNGNNYVAPNQEYVVPSNCTDRPGINCVLPVLPPVGTEIFTFIFSRDRLDELPNDAEAASKVRLTPQQIFQFYKESGQKLCESQLKDVPYALKIININTKDNEEIIKTFFLNKVGLR